MQAILTSTITVAVVAGSVNVNQALGFVVLLLFMAGADQVRKFITSQTDMVLKESIYLWLACCLSLKKCGVRSLKEAMQNVADSCIKSSMAWSV